MNDRMTRPYIIPVWPSFSTDPVPSDLPLLLADHAARYPSPPNLLALVGPNGWTCCTYRELADLGTFLAPLVP